MQLWQGLWTCGTAGSKTPLGSPALENGPGKGQGSSALCSAPTTTLSKRPPSQTRTAFSSPHHLPTTRPSREPRRCDPPIADGVPGAAGGAPELPRTRSGCLAEEGPPAAPSRCMRRGQRGQAGMHLRRERGAPRGRGRGPRGRQAGAAASAAPPAGEAQRRSPLHLPPSPASRPRPPPRRGEPAGQQPAPLPSPRRPPGASPRLHSRSLPRGRLAQRPPAHPSCASSLRGDKAGMAMRHTEELWEAPTPDSVINFHQATATTAPGIPRWASACKGGREV